MTTTAQKALEDFEKTWLTIAWSTMTTTQKNTHIANHYALKIAAAKEIKANRIEAEAEQVALTAQRRQQAITYLQNHGFAVDNSQADWYKLYNRPRIFGANWQAQADYQMSLSTGVDYFIAKAYELWEEFVKTGE